MSNQKLLHFCIQQALATGVWTILFDTPLILHGKSLFITIFGFGCASFPTCSKNIFTRNNWVKAHLTDQWYLWPTAFFQETALNFLTQRFLCDCKGLCHYPTESQPFFTSSFSLLVKHTGRRTYPQCKALYHILQFNPPHSPVNCFYPSTDETQCINVPYPHS